MEQSLLGRKSKADNISAGIINCTYLSWARQQFYGQRPWGYSRSKGGHESAMSFLVQAGVLRERTSTQCSEKDAVQKAAEEQSGSKLIQP
ncbi:hypothetical protein QYF61_010417, partial [Mycteria americana]